MTNVIINGRLFDIDLIIFDKDGTLISLNLWSKQVEKWGGLLQKKLELSNAQVQDIYAKIGYDYEGKQLRANHPVAVGSVQQINTIASFLLFQMGFAWTEAEQVVHEVSADSMETAPDLDMLDFLGDVPAALSRLRDAGIKIAVATSDDRIPTEKTLELLKIDHLVDGIVCANDPLPKKPAPDGLLHVAAQLGVDPTRMLMVGDSSGDMQAGRNANAAGCILIGEGITADFDAHITTIEEILPQP